MTYNHSIAARCCLARLCRDYTSAICLYEVTETKETAMTFDEIKIRRLAGQHLLSPADTQTVVKDLCGLQAQFLRHALHGLSIRTNKANTDGLVKSWTIRGTMHLFSVDDLPLFLHEGRTNTLRPVDTMESDAYIGAEQKAYFAELIMDAVSQGIDGREALKEICEKAGMGELEAKSLFDPWGGTIRALCEAGRICHKVQEKKAYQICPAFEPMEEQAAQKELLRRYFANYGPATVKDAAYFFGVSQAKVKECLKELPVLETVVDGKAYFFIDVGAAKGSIPECLFLAGFDPLMLGYEKTESLFLPAQYMRNVFSLSGIVRPAILIDGNVAGLWNMKGKQLTVSMFDDRNAAIVANTAHSLWPDLKKIEFK